MICRIYYLNHDLLDNLQFIRQQKPYKKCRYLDENQNNKDEK